MPRKAYLNLYRFCQAFVSVYRLTAGPATIAVWRFHDLRRSMRTGLSSLRIADTVSELCIAHTRKELHKVYDQHSYLDEKRHALETWAARVMAICEPGAPSNIIPLRN